MKNIELINAKVDKYSYKLKIEKDLNTINYSINYIKDLEKDNVIIENKIYIAYIKDCNINKFIGYIKYQYNKIEEIYEVSILIEYKYRYKGYIKDSLKLLIKYAYESNINYLYCKILNKRNYIIKIFRDIGFEIYNKDINNIIVRIKTNKVLPNYSNTKTINDVLNFMKDNIRYGWIDINNNIHIGNMSDFRKLYRTLSIDEMLHYGIGTCIDQVKLMNYLLNKINVKNKMFATRIYESNDFNNINEEEHMHCFILCYINNKVYHIEHPNFYRIGIYEYKSEEEAINNINKYYIELSNGVPRPVTEFYSVKEGILFKEFNNYLNDLDISFRRLQNKNSDYEIIYNWTQNEFVYKYFEQRKLSYKDIENKYKLKLKDNIQELYIIRSNNKDIGLVQIYKYNEDINIKELNKYKNIYEYDLFIGDKDYINKGLGIKIVIEINNLILKKYNSDSIILRPFKENIRACKCYEKANFKKIYEYLDKDTLGNNKDIIIYIKELR